MSAHSLLETRDCTAWSCTAEATGEDGLCDRHRDVAAANGRTCKRDGCSQAPFQTRGRYAGLCREHTDEAKDEQSRRQLGKPRGGSLSAVPPPAPESEGHDEGTKRAQVTREPARAQASERAPEGTLVELANGVERASQAVTVAEEVLAQARRDLRDALTSLGSALEERQAAAA